MGSNLLDFTPWILHERSRWSACTTVVPVRYVCLLLLSGITSLIHVDFLYCSGGLDFHRPLPRFGAHSGTQYWCVLFWPHKPILLEL